MIPVRAYWFVRVYALRVCMGDFANGQEKDAVVCC